MSDSELIVPSPLNNEPYSEFCRSYVEVHCVSEAFVSNKFLYIEFGAVKFSPISYE
jgi:hypothetical protein